jgi:hypothetical protein
VWVPYRLCRFVSPATVWVKYFILRTMACFGTGKQKVEMPKKAKNYDRHLSKANAVASFRLGKL